MRMLEDFHVIISIERCCIYLIPILGFNCAIAQAFEHDLNLLGNFSQRIWFHPQIAKLFFLNMQCFNLLSPLKPYFESGISLVFFSNSSTKHLSMLWRKNRWFKNKIPIIQKWLCRWLWISNKKFYTRSNAASLWNGISNSITNRILSISRHAETFLCSVSGLPSENAY